LLKSEIRRECPDVIVYVCKAKEVDANVRFDLEFLNQVVEFTRKTYAVDSCPVLAVVNQVDELDPAHVTTPPFEDPVKRENMQRAVEHLGEMFKMHYRYYADDKIVIRPICSYMYFQDGHLACDRRWQIDELLDEILALLPDEALLSMMKLGRFQEVRRKLSNRIVNTFTMATGIIGAEPIPYADLPILTSLQVSMIGMIQAVAGRGASMRNIRDFLAATGINITGAFTVREVVRALVKLLPGAGSLISGTVAAGYTKLIGTTAINHFIEGDEIGKATAKAEQATGRAWTRGVSA
ncbi:MAG TPA: hypothetical protein PKO06_12145, partial [Candidatus Ozemobacteraceae bacterium]|nr:hypothetical protein [Candidatus Ozemobacteraceae bacterium]